MSSKLRPCFTARPSQIYRAIGIIQCRDDLVCSQFCFTGLGLYIHMDEWAFSTRNDLVSSLLFHRFKTIHTMDEWQSRPKFCKIRRMPWFFSCVWELWMKYCDCNLIFQIMTPNMASVSYDKTTTESLKLEEIQNGQHINRKQNKTLKCLEIWFLKCLVTKVPLFKLLSQHGILLFTNTTLISFSHSA